MIQIQETQALRQALLTEKSSLREAYSNRIITEEDSHTRSLEIDKKLDALDLNGND